MHHPNLNVHSLNVSANRRRVLTGMAAGLAAAALAPALARASMTNDRGATIVTQHADEAVTSDYLTVPGARLYYEVSGSGPVLLLIHGAPADADAFIPIVGLLEGDYTVVRYDTRGISRSRADDPTADIPLEVHADDARRILAQFGDEPAYVLGSSGGAVIGLALTARFSERVKILVAHEPPLVSLLPESDPRRTGPQEIADTYRDQGAGPAIGEFITFAGGQSDQAAPSEATPSPAMQEMMARMMENFNVLFARYLVPITSYVPDTAALQAAPSEVVVGVGETTTGQVAHDAALALAEQLGTEPVTFPGGHGGYTEYPEAFVTTLQEVFQSS